ncbi:MAG: hypothetical protein K2H61_08265 [Muribaculaceae bacterium]|nr:hypothetical protein [Muribaculaceae bacterium]
MKNSTKIFILLSAIILTSSLPVYSDIWDYTLIGMMRDKKKNKAEKSGGKKKDKAKDILKAAQQEDVIKIAAHNGDPLSMDQLLEMGIIYSHSFVEDLENYGVDISSKIACEPFTDITDPMYEWTQFDNATGSVKMEQSGLILDSRNALLSSMSVTDLQFDPKDSSFEFGLSFYMTPAEDNKYVGMVLDYENNKQYKAIIFSKKEFIYYTVDKGESSVIKQGLVKPGKFIHTIYAKYEGSVLKILLNGLEVTTLSRVTISSPIFGVIVSGKRKAICDGFYFNIIDEQDGQEQSTSDI